MTWETIEIAGKIFRIAAADSPVCVLIQPTGEHEQAHLTEEAGQILQHASCEALVVLFQCLITELDRAVYPEAKAGRCGHCDFSHVELFLRSPGRLLCLLFLFQCGTLFVLCNFNRCAVLGDIMQNRKRRIIFYHCLDAVHDTLPHGVHFMGCGICIQPVVCGIQGLSHPDTDAAAEV